ncbi:MAG: tyrosine protein phosphatase, partial [Chloroflexia bacterium]
MYPDLYTLELPGPGRLSIMARPRGGDWLEDEISALRRVGVACLVSLLTPDEAEALELTEEATLCRACGLRFLSLPIQDRDVPEAPRLLSALLVKLGAEFDAGRHVVIHCRQGIGRASLVAASLLVGRGYTLDQAFTCVAQARGRDVPDTDEQRAWV